MKSNLIAIVLLVSLSACMTDPKYVEEDFGKSVKQMVNAQIYDPAVASQPDVEPPLLIDGDVVGTGVDNYREAAKRETKSSGFTFTIQ